MTQAKRRTTLVLGGLVFTLFTFLSHAAVQPQQACVPPSPGTVSWWPGDGTAMDIADGDHGTMQNGAAFAAGKVGQAFSLDGLNDIVHVANSSNLEPQQVSVYAPGSLRKA